MKHDVHIKANKAKVERLLAEPQTEDEWLGSGTLYGESVIFKDGYMMDVRICGVLQFEEGGCNSAWTEAVLYDPFGFEVACTDAGEDFFGEWQIERNGNEYKVTIEEE